jgi:hypothetical protein
VARVLRAIVMRLGLAMEVNKVIQCSCYSRSG